MKPTNLLLAFSTFFLFIIIAACDGQEESIPVPDPVPDPVVEPEVEKSYQLVWADEFDTAEIDTTKWSFQIGDGTEYGIPGWGNNELEYYTDREENAFLDSGNLVIVAREEKFNNFSYTSARMRTKDLADWKFGRVEVKARLPRGQGIWPAIWMLPTQEVYGDWPTSGEIDIMELVGHEPNTVHGTIHFGPAWPDNKFIGSPFVLESGEFYDEFHEFSIEWEMDQISFFVDGQSYFNVTKSTTSPHVYPFNQFFHLILNIAVGGNWPGPPDTSTEFPQRMEIDYIRIYQLQ
ncbi:MAG: glycoside hydrolase family 16 protein [Bacteroidota bacterium]